MTLIAWVSIGFNAFLLFVLFGASRRCQDLETQRDTLRKALKK